MPPEELDKLFLNAFMKETNKIIEEPPRKLSVTSLISSLVIHTYLKAIKSHK